MTDKPKDDHIEKVYTEASNWLRIVNIIEWSMSGIFVPLSLSCFPLAVKYPALKIALAFASIFFMGFWVYISFLYSSSARIARESLFAIESRWQLDSQLAFYTRQGVPSSRWYGLRNSHFAMFGILVLAWLSYILI
ncbi:hypothetical protein ACFL9T_23335 [Thermodesulfobacteriota bacterium]